MTTALTPPSSHNPNPFIGVVLARPEGSVILVAPEDP